MKYAIKLANQTGLRSWGKRSLLSCLWIVYFLNASAQDPFFSQFYSAPNVLSPSLAGSSGGTRFVANYRNQWPGISKAYQTMAFSADMYVNKYRSGFGLVVISDKAGTAALNTTILGLQYAYRVKLSQSWQFVPGLQFSIGQKSIDPSKVILPDGSSSGSSTGSLDYLNNTKSTYVDGVASLFFYSPKVWNGFTFDHLFHPSYSFTSQESFLPFKFVSFGGFNLWTEQSRILNDSRSASICYRFAAQNGFKQLDIGSYWYGRALEFGLWYRGLPVFNKQEKDNQFFQSDAVVLMVGASFGSFRIGYSYDIQISSISSSGAGAHEVSLIFEMGELFGCGAHYFDCFAKSKGLRFSKDLPRRLDVF